MAHHLLSVIRPCGFDPSISLGADARREIDRLNREMDLAGIRVFVVGLHPPTSAFSVSTTENGGPVLTEGPVFSGCEYLDGFWVLECATRGDALTWAAKASRACQARIEVRPFH